MIETYGALWPANATPLQIEMQCIRQGGTWLQERGGKQVECGKGLPCHYERVRKILWPDLDNEDDGQRWHKLCRDTILQNRVTVLMGPASTGKTHEAAWPFLVEYFCHPNETLILMSSTHIDGLRLRIWGEVSNLWQQAVDAFPWLPGHLLDTKLLISTDEVSEDSFDERRVRDWRKGIKGVPCMQNNKFVGISKYVGIKQKRIRLVGDELSLMGGSFLSGVSNLDKNEDFKAVFCFNPLDPMDQGGKAAEPLDGWQAYLAPAKTTTWRGRFMNAAVINLIGTDSPNFDFPQDQKSRFPYLIDAKKIERTRASFGPDSVEFQSQCVGSMKSGMLERRVITRELCERFGATLEVSWKGTQLTRIFHLDTAWGGDRCIAGHSDFGQDVDGKVIFSPNEPLQIPLRIGVGVKPVEDQIAEWVVDYCQAWGIPPENVFHDSTGRGTLGTALARAWSAMTNPVEFGGKPTDRPVNLDMYIQDPATKRKRLKRCDEHYFNFVTELWFTAKYAIEAGQIRNLPAECMEELCMRKWEFQSGKYQVEPKSLAGGSANSKWKQGMKERTGRSPDNADWLVIGLEGARRRGFAISKLANAEQESADRQWIEDLARKGQEQRSRHQLNYQT